MLFKCFFVAATANVPVILGVVAGLWQMAAGSWRLYQQQAYKLCVLVSLSSTNAGRDFVCGSLAVAVGAASALHYKDAATTFVVHLKYCS